MVDIFLTRSRPLSGIICFQRRIWIPDGLDRYRSRPLSGIICFQHGFVITGEDITAMFSSPFGDYLFSTVVEQKVHSATPGSRPLSGIICFQPDRVLPKFTGLL